MKIERLNSKLQENEIKIDEFGRLIIDDPELMLFVTGGSGELMAANSNTYCKSNGACGNARCANSKCK